GAADRRREGHLRAGGADRPERGAVQPEQARAGPAEEGPDRPAQRPEALGGRGGGAAAHPRAGEVAGGPGGGRVPGQGGEGERRGEERDRAALQEPQGGRRRVAQGDGYGEGALPG